MAATPEQFLQRLISTRLADLNGTHISGTIALNDELGNEMLQLLLQQMMQPSSIPGTKTSPEGSVPNPAELLSLLNIRRLDYATAKGKVQLNLDLAVDGSTNA